MKGDIAMDNLWKAIIKLSIIVLLYTFALVGMCYITAQIDKGWEIVHQDR
jgi:hypothetical protein